MTRPNATHLPEQSGWTRVGRSNPLLEYIDNALRGCGQVIFMDNPLTGILNFVAMFWGAHTGGTTLAVAIGSVVGTFVATAVAYLLRVDRGALRMGLYGFNGMLVGAGIPTFLGATPVMWVVLVLASAASTVVMLAVANMMSTFKAPAFTFPFVLTTWFVMLAAYKLSALSIVGLPHAALAVPPAAAGGTYEIYEFIRASFVSVSQVFFVDDPISGAIFLLALVVESRWCAGLALFGGAVGVGVAMLMGADVNMINHGLWGYSAVLTAPAIGTVFMKTNPGTLIFAAAATVMTVLVQAAMFTATGTLGIPAFTFPFVLTSWLFVIAQRNFEPRSTT